MLINVWSFVVLFVVVVVRVMLVFERFVVIKVWKFVK